MIPEQAGAVFKPSNTRKVEIMIENSLIRRARFKGQREFNGDKLVINRFAVSCSMRIYKNFAWHRFRLDVINCLIQCGLFRKLIAAANEPQQWALPRDPKGWGAFSHLPAIRRVPYSHWSRRSILCFNHCGLKNKLRLNKNDATQNFYIFS